MKIAIFYPKNLIASWYTLGGYSHTLRKMGHEVLDCPLPGNQVRFVEQLRESLPKIDQLAECDVIISAFHEYMEPWLEAIYGFEAWSKLKVPVIARFDESFDRADLKLHSRWESMKKWAQFYSFPAAQDATKYKGQFLPFGADTDMFHPLEGEQQKAFPLAFIGSMYESRQKYLRKLAEVMPPEFTFNLGQCIVQDLGGIRGLESNVLLAANYREIKIFFCLPPLSRLVVAKVVDVMACGTFVMYPKLVGDAAPNLAQFEHGKHIVYYDAGYLKKNAEQILYFLQDDAKREEIAAAGCKLVHEKYTLVRMLEQLISLVSTSKLINTKLLLPSDIRKAGPELVRSAS